MSLQGWSEDGRTHLHWGNMHGWMALEGFHPEHFQTILFAPPGLPAGTHTHTHTQIQRPPEEGCRTPMSCSRCLARALSACAALCAALLSLLFALAATYIKQVSLLSALCAAMLSLLSALAVLMGS